MSDTQKPVSARAGLLSAAAAFMIGGPKVLEATVNQEDRLMAGNLRGSGN